MPKISVLLLDIGNVVVRLRTEAFLKTLTPLCRPGTTKADVLAGLRDPKGRHDEYERGCIDGQAFYEAQAQLLGLSISRFQWDGIWNAYFEPNRPMEALLARLQGQLRFWALSNTNAAHLEYLKRNFRLFDGYAGFTASNLVGARKPEPAIYLAAIKALGVPPDQILYLDDVPEYVEAGRSQGLRAFHYTFNDEALKTELLALGLELPGLDGRSSLAC